MEGRAGRQSDWVRSTFDWRFIGQIIQNTKYIMRAEDTSFETIHDMTRVLFQENKHLALLHARREADQSIGGDLVEC